MDFTEHLNINARVFTLDQKLRTLSNIFSNMTMTLSPVEPQYCKLEVETKGTALENTIPSTIGGQRLNGAAGFAQTQSFQRPSVTIHSLDRGDAVMAILTPMLTENELAVIENAAVAITSALAAAKARAESEFMTSIKKS